MGLFSKKKEIGSEQVPELPELPEPSGGKSPLIPTTEIPDVPSGLPKIKTQTLPILPDSEMGNKFKQEAIKHAISKPPQALPTPQPAQEPPPIAPKENITGKRTLEIQDIRPQQNNQPTKKTEPVFIRLDKFQAATETFEELKNKILDIEDLLKKTREIKIKEEEELAGWEREFQIIKSRIDLINKDIFNELE